MADFSEKMRKFVSEFQSKNINSDYNYLVLDFLHSFIYQDYWNNKLFPLLYNLQKDKKATIDWNSFDWDGKVCFRHNYVMILDKSINQPGRKFPPILDETDSPIVDEGGQWLENTEYIEKHYSEFVKLPLDDFIEICKKWYDEVISN